jgi:hypothetical protein
MYLATGLQISEAEPEDTEKLQIKKIPVQKAINMALNGEIKDILSVTTLLTYALKVPSLHLP